MSVCDLTCVVRPMCPTRCSRPGQERSRDNWIFDVMRNRFARVFLRWEGGPVDELVLQGAYDAGWEPPFRG